MLLWNWGLKNDKVFQVFPSTLSAMVDLKSQKTLYGLTERIVGVESLIFLASQFEYIQHYVRHLVPEEKHHFIDQFYSQVCVKNWRENWKNVCQKFSESFENSVKFLQMVERFKKGVKNRMGKKTIDYKFSEELVQNCEDIGGENSKKILKNWRENCEKNWRGNCGKILKKLKGEIV